MTLIPAGLAIVASTYGLSRYTYGLFLPDIRADLGLSTEVMGLIGSGSYAGYLAATLFGSTISGTLGPRLPVVLGGLAAALGMALMAVSGEAWMLAVGVILAGTSPGLAYPPLSDAVMRLIAEPQQNRTYAIINAGTSVGVIVSGPAALLAGEAWRFAWMGFAVFAALATVWNATLMPTGSYAHGATGGAPARLGVRWLVGPRSGRMFAAATLFGIATAVYWTFAVDLLVRAGGIPDAWSRVVWTLIGAFGLLGGAAGDLTRTHGLRRTFRVALLAITGAILALALAPGVLAVGLTSGIVFGGTFIMITGLFGIWSVNIFVDRPSAGFGATFFLISAGQLIGPALAGVIAGWQGLGLAFVLSAALCGVTIGLGPRRDVFAMGENQDDPAAVGACTSSMPDDPSPGA
jgi:predicted MFS family arabinose efflux permease